MIFTFLQRSLRYVLELNVIKRSFFFVVFLFFYVTSAQGIQEFESLVIDQKFNSSSTIIIDQKEIEKSHAKDLTSLLASQANISITQSNFQPNSIYLRGGDSSHVLILVDGIPFYDTASVQRTTNLNSINLKSVQRIEVIKGSQSVLFGGQALSGVIKIDTFPTEMKTAHFIQSQIGTQQSVSFTGGITQSIIDNQGIIVRASVSRKNNISPVLGSSKTYPSQLAGGDIGYIYHGNDFETLFKIQTSFDKTLIASSDFVSYQSVDADNFETSTYQLSGMGSIRAINTQGRPTLSLATQKSARIYEQDFVSSNGSPTKQDYHGDLQFSRFEITPIDFQKLKTKLGLSHTEEKLIYQDMDILKSDDKTDFEGAFVKIDYLPSSKFHLEAGARADYKKFKNQINTYQLGATLFNEVRLEFSTGFKQPSLFQLYSSYGNINLEPEKSTSTSISYEKNFTSDWFFSATYFENIFSNLIVALGTPLHYENVSRSKTVGFEVVTGLHFLERQLFINLALGYQEPRDLDKDNWLVRRPLRTASLKLRKDFNQLGLGLEIIHNGDRRDILGSGKYGTLNSFTYANSTIEYRKNADFTLFMRGQNITDQRYETSYSFYDEGFSLSVGGEATF